MCEPNGLWNRNFLLFWQGQAVSLVGSSLSTVAVALWIVEATGSAALLGGVMMAGTLAGLLVTPVAGALADRYPRTRIIVWCDAAQGVLALALAGAVWAFPEVPSLALVALFLFHATGMGLSALFAAAARAVVPDLVPPGRVASANTATVALVQTAGLVGKGVGGTAYRLLGAPVLLALDGITYLISAISETFIRAPRAPARPSGGWSETARSLARETKEGFRYVWGHPGLRAAVLVTACIAFCLEPLVVLLPFLVKDARFLGVPADWYGYLLAGYGAATLAGYWLAGRVDRGSPPGGGLLAGGAIAVAGLGFVGLGLARRPGAALGWIMASGLALGFYNNCLLSRVQIKVPPELRARALTAFQALATGLVPVGIGLAGAVAELPGRRVDLVFEVAGLLVLLAGLTAGLHPGYRGFLSTRSP
ncbi:MAG: MFS transporter, partial [Deltaproteobacteria bacterium]|nr:MFS transporter [Deltaproteobacteria bacterium]